MCHNMYMLSRYIYNYESVISCTFHWMIISYDMQGDCNLDGRRFVIVLDSNCKELPHRIRYVGVPVHPGTKYNSEHPSARTVYTPQIIMPIPWHNTECPVCISSTHECGHEMSCGHIVGWECSMGWKKKCEKKGQKHTCPICRATQPFGNYYDAKGSSANNNGQIVSLRMSHSCGWCLCTVFSVSEPVHTNLTKTDILIIYDCLTNEWLDCFKESKYGKDFVMGIIEAIQFTESHTVRQLIESTVSRCGWCGTKVTKARCSQCKRAQYCSKECQTLHWPEHKTKCIRIKNETRKNKTQKVAELGSLQDCFTAEVAVCGLQPTA